MTASSLPTRIGSAAKCASVVVCATTSGASNIAPNRRSSSGYGGQETYARDDANWTP